MCSASVLIFCSSVFDFIPPPGAGDYGVVPCHPRWILYLQIGLFVRFDGHVGLKLGVGT